MADGLNIKVNRKGVKYIEDGEGNILQKQCRKCHSMEDIKNFHSKSTGFVGTESECKKCKKQKNDFAYMIRKLKKEIQQVGNC